jgi:hypothetical protein
MHLLTEKLQNATTLIESMNHMVRDKESALEMAINTNQVNQAKIQ